MHFSISIFDFSLNQCCRSLFTVTDGATLYLGIIRYTQITHQNIVVIMYVVRYGNERFFQDWSVQWTLIELTCQTCLTGFTLIEFWIHLHV